MLRRVVEDDGMTRRQERLLKQRLLLSTRQQRRRKDVEIVQDSTYWSTSYGQYESEGEKAVNEQRQMHDGVCHGGGFYESERCRFGVAAEDYQKIVKDVQMAKHR
ncbi:hypothetical protein L917_21272 [Phytophthora nicotianae]|uniref:Uncharacterized protein n=1 Tax=Phytophthora nicotianae TaxID=4792 RepID=W2JY02_PHYNI|nr:hypothetical protein L917_21272 [Phytophthora nicotianae]